jgi:hypothetical protein
MSVKRLRDYQSEGASAGYQILKKHGIVYFQWEVRLGKTPTALETCRLYGAKKVLFLTKKKAISSIESDYTEFGFDEHFDILVTNDESMHKIDDCESFDVVIHDEHHRFSSNPKPGSATRLFRQLFSHKPMIFLSGTPSPESFSQMFHQFWVSDRSPWRQYLNFYKWAKDGYVDVKQKKINGLNINDYSAGNEHKIMGDIAHLCLTRTQGESGFTSKITEHKLYVTMSPMTYNLERKLTKDLVVEGKEEVILADTPAKLMQKLMQLEGGTMKFESGNSKVLDLTKAQFVKWYFAGKKIGIFYVFKEELNALRQVFGSENLTTDLDEFNSTDKAIALQVVSGREGISLKNADCLVMYNIQHSAVSFWQARDRLTTMDRLENHVFWILSDGMIGEKIYKVVQGKKKYTLNHFKKDYGNSSK